MRWYEIFESNLLELFDGAAPYQWRYKDDQLWNGQFKIGTSSYSFSALKLTSGKWEIEFADHTQPTRQQQWSNTGDQREKSAQVFGTVISMIKDFLEGETPNEVTFSASVNDNRGSLYTKLVKREEPRIRNMGYDIRIEDTGANIIYSFYKQDSN